MKCPDGTVEISVWSSTVYFDTVHNSTTSADALGWLPSGEPITRAVLKALKPITDLGVHKQSPAANMEIWFIDPEIFEELTKDIDDHDYPGQFYRTSGKSEK